MIGTKFFEITAEDFVRGVTSSPNLQDGGLSNESNQMNITAIPGVLYPPGGEVDESTNVTGEMIASAGDNAYVPKDRYMLDDEAAFYIFDVSTVTKKVTASSATVTQGTTDMLTWGDYVYATTSAGSGGDIIRYDKSTTLVEDYWTGAGTLNQAALSAITPWRPLIVFEKNLYIGDGNKLHRVDEALTVSNGILQFATNEVISAIGIDQGSGLLLIATSFGSNYSGTEHVETRIYVYDGFSNKARRVVPISGLVTAFKSVGNTTYVFYGNKLGFWTGSGIEYLRTLNFAKDLTATMIYPHRTCSIDNTLYYIDNLPQNSGTNKQIMAYGETIDNVKVFYPILYSSSADSSITALFPVRSHELGYAFATDKFYTFDIENLATVISGGALVTTKRYKFPRDVTFNGIIVEFDGAYPSSPVNDTPLRLRITDSKGNTSPNNGLLVDGRTDMYEWEMTAPTIETRSVEILISFSPSTAANVVGIRRMTVFYTPKE